MKRFLILVALFILSSLGFLWFFQRMEAVSGTSGMLDTTLFYTPEEAYLFLTTLGEQGRQIYLQALVLDLIYPVIYGLLLFSLLKYFYQRSAQSRWARMLLYLPGIPVVLDYLENALEFLLLIRYPNPSEGIAYLSGSLVTPLKWLSVVLVILTIIFWSILSQTREGNIS